MTCIVKCNGRFVDYIYVNQWENLQYDPLYIDYPNISISIPMEILSINNTITIESVIPYYNLTAPYHSEASVSFYSSENIIFPNTKPAQNPYKPRLECYLI
ncbi:MAG: hypothetical protein ACFFD2_22180 [Promethearchaeota archaeon]